MACRPHAMLIMHLFILSQIRSLPLLPCSDGETRSHYNWIKQQLRGGTDAGHKLHLGFVVSAGRAHLVYK